MEKLDVIIFSGQSNMQGQSERLSNTERVKNAYEYKYLTDSLSPLSNPVGENIRNDESEGYTFCEGTDIKQWLSDHVLGAACYGHTNLVPEFCRNYIEESGASVIAVHAAKGSTEISYWMPNTKAYEILINKARRAIAMAKREYEIGKIYFIWLQGESDAIAKRTKNYYKEQITLLCDSLKKDIGINKFGIIRVGRFTKDIRDLEIITAQDEICLENENFLMLTDIATKLNEMPEYMNQYVGGHYSAAGLEKLGKEAGKTLAKYKKQSEDK